MAERDSMDSLAAAGKLAQSTRVRALLGYLWLLLLPAFGAASGYFVKATETKTELVALRLQQAAFTRDIASLRDEVRANLALRRETIRVGKQAAYATAALEAYEAASLLKKKRVYGDKYAAAYEKMTLDGQSADVAYTALFRPGELP